MIGYAAAPLVLHVLQCTCSRIVLHRPPPLPAALPLCQGLEADVCYAFVFTTP